MGWQVNQQTPRKDDSIVYVTIARVAGGGVTVRATAPTADPPTLPDGAKPVCTAGLCPPTNVDRTTGAIRAVQHVVNIDRAFATAVAATRPTPNLTGPVAGVLAHPGIGRLLVVGPFDQPADLDQWWHWRGNRFPRASIVCLPIALSTQQAAPTEGAIR